VPTCGLTCGKACPAAQCKNFVTCGKGAPQRLAHAQTPAQLSMDGDDQEGRRCRLGASMPRLRSAALPATSAGADFWRKWVSRGSEALEEAEAFETCRHEEAPSPQLPRASTLEDYEEKHEEEARSRLPKAPRANGSTRRLSAPPARRSHRASSVGRARGFAAQRNSFPRSHRASSQHKLRKAEEQETANSPRSPEPVQAPASGILDPGLAAVVPASGVQLEHKELPRPPCSNCWDWPLTRHEKKARVLLIDKRVLMMDRQNLQEELDILRNLETAWC